MTALRWLLVLPVAILGGFLLTYPAHLLLFVAGETLHVAKRLAPIDRALIDFTGPVGFVYFGARTAPNHKAGTAAFLAVFLTVAVFAARVAGEFIGSPIDRAENWNPISIGMGLGGALLGVLGAQRLAEPKPRRKAKPTRKRASSAKSPKKPARSR